MYSVLGPLRNVGCTEERSVPVVRPNQWGCPPALAVVLGVTW